MLDKFIYKTLDLIVKWCEQYREYRIKRSLPRETWDLKAKQKGLKRWVKQSENSYK